MAQTDLVKAVGVFQIMTWVIFFKLMTFYDDKIRAKSSVYLHWPYQTNQCPCAAHCKIKHPPTQAQK